MKCTKFPIISGKYRFVDKLGLTGIINVGKIGVHSLNENKMIFI